MLFAKLAIVPLVTSLTIGCSEEKIPKSTPSDNLGIINTPYFGPISKDEFGEYTSQRYFLELDGAYADSEVEKLTNSHN